MLNLFQTNKSEPPQFSGQETQTGIQFTAPSDTLSLIEYADNLPTDAYHAQAQWLLMRELLDNGQAESSDIGIHVPFIVCIK